MNKAREVKLITAEEKSEGSGAQVLRPFPGSQLSHVDPFVLMDEFFVDSSAGFPEHPHRGFEAVTYMLSGGFVHEDSAGNRATVKKGGLQRITMGSGIKHSESPAGDEESHGIQLWINLSKYLKNIEPGYQIVPEDELRTEIENGVKIKTLVDEKTGPEIKTFIEYRDIELENTDFSWQVRGVLQGFIYVIDGKGACKTEDGEIELSGGKAVAKDFPGEIELEIETAGSLKFISLVGKPHDEPINMHGPYVD